MRVKFIVSFSMLIISKLNGVGCSGTKVGPHICPQETVNLLQSSFGPRGMLPDLTSIDFTPGVTANANISITPKLQLAQPS